MIEFYPQIRFVHIAAVLASGTLFFIRGLAVQLGACWPQHAAVRYLSYSIDTVLLTAAFMLMTVLHQYPLQQSWLTVKIALIIVYIVLGSFAISTGRTRNVRWACYIAALLLFGLIVSVARAHHPLGLFR